MNLRLNGTVGLSVSTPVACTGKVCFLFPVTQVSAISCYHNGNLSKEWTNSQSITPSLLQILYVHDRQ